MELELWLMLLLLVLAGQTVRSPVHKAKPPIALALVMEAVLSVTAVVTLARRGADAAVPVATVAAAAVAVVAVAVARHVTRVASL